MLFLVFLAAVNIYVILLFLLILGLFKNVVSTSGYLASNDRMNTELGRIRKEAFVV
jgi:hypothetical protein